LSAPDFQVHRSDHKGDNQPQSQPPECSHRVSLRGFPPGYAFLQRPARGGLQSRDAPPKGPIALSDHKSGPFRPQDIA
jgi:hypothetical protein